MGIRSLQNDGQSVNIQLIQIMNDIKLRLNLCVPGAQMLSRQECLKNPKESYNTEKMTLVYTVGKGKNTKKKKEILTIRTRKSRVVKQNINITTEAYYHMINASEPPTAKYARAVGYKHDGTPISLWSTMSIDKRLKVHLDLMAEHFNASKYSYEILDD